MIDHHAVSGAVILKTGTGTLIGAIVGVGPVRNASTVRWGTAGNIVRAWIFTILPGSA